MRRGQAAIEFLTTYGWAIMVGLLLVGALGYYGAMNTERFYPEMCTFGPGLGCLEFAADSDTGEVYLGIQNNLAETILWANMTVESAECSNWPLTIQYQVIENGDRMLLPTENGYTVIPCDFTSNKMKGYISVNYRLIEEKVDHTVEGEFKLWAQRD